MEGENERRSTTRRAEDRAVCPLHHTHCLQIKEATAEAKKKVPLWTVPVLVSILIAVLGSFMLSQKTVQNDIKKMVTSNASTLSEVRMNQRLVMQELSIEYQYYDYDK